MQRRERRRSLLTLIGAIVVAALASLPTAVRGDIIESQLYQQVDGNLIRIAPRTGANYFPALMAGDPNGNPPDSPAIRVDANVPTSLFAGVGSISPGGGTCTAVPITPFHLLTAGHCIDQNGDGIIDVNPANVTFFLNNDGNQTHTIVASALAIQPDFTGFDNPSVNDDIAIITLSSPIPQGIPIYDIVRTPVPTGTVFTLVGYGQSGDGINGFTTSATATRRRVGQNVADVFVLDDEAGGAAEVFEYDFDHPTNQTLNLFGGASLGNDVETSLGGGDSGGPSFIDVNGELKVVGINTFRFSVNGGPASPLFGSGGGGILVPAYADWIDSVTGVPEPSTVAILVTGAAALLLKRRRRAHA